jgi:hypothetical protein
MKKLIAILFTCLMAFSLAGCSEYKDATSTGSGTTATVPGQNQPTGDTNTAEESFTVSLILNGEPYVPTVAMSAIWRDGVSVIKADFDSSGVAKANGLDGDYSVTLSTLPDGYTYNPNIYTATNDSKSVTITLFPLTAYTGTGADRYTNIITINSTGFYRATLTSPEQTIFFQYEPKISGSYVLSSLLDVSANEINPILDIYKGNRQYKPEKPTETIDDGGESSSYTKNFTWQINLTSDMIGNVYAFGLRTESIKKDAFPIDIDFMLERDGEFEGDESIVYTEVTPQEVFKKTPEYRGKTYVSVASQNPVTTSSGTYYLLDPDKFKLNEEDGYYHVYDSQTDTYGAILYAKINKDCEIFNTDSGKGFKDELVNLRINGKNYAAFIDAYSEYTNSDGAYAVTKELKVFLQEFAISQRLFSDGNGFAESQYNYQASEKNQWLFGCGYYI